MKRLMNESIRPHASIRPIIIAPRLLRLICGLDMLADFYLDDFGYVSHTGSG